VSDVDGERAVHELVDATLAGMDLAAWFMRERMNCARHVKGL
jgi:hypothetical protein